MNTDSESINAVEGAIEFPGDVVEFESVNDGGSIVSFWVEKPGRLQGKVKFSGIIPGGYVGNDGYLFSMLFRAKKIGEARLVSTDEHLFLSDGRGSEATVGQATLSVRIIEQGMLPKFAESPDKDPPEPFTPRVAREQSMFNGKWFVVFATQDKGSGMDHYEIKETRYGMPAIWGWSAAESPFLLKDQGLNSFIYLKAIDRAGNERAVAMEPRNYLPWYKDYVIWVIIALIIAVLAVGVKSLCGRIFRL